MSKTVKREIIDVWVRKHYPDGLSQLAVASQIPANTIAKVRLGYVPRNPNRRADLARALGVKEAELFPEAGKGRAS